MQTFTTADVQNFFSHSDVLDYLVLRPLSHITSSWETQWDAAAARYEPEPGSFADDLNAVVEMISKTAPPAKYHENEDTLAESVVRDLKWPIQKKGTRWIGADYQSILEQGGFHDLGQRDLLSAAAGRVHAAFKFGQRHIDQMEDGHRTMLTALMTIIIYHRYCDGSCLYTELLDDAVE